ncbi:MAG: hypothetical protein JWN44_4104 [Myxococcales bacterium]|nr:hypothetical protein [Myxococcales bacterium]
MRNWLTVIVVGASLAGCASSKHAQRPATPSEAGDGQVATAKEAPKPKELGSAIKIVGKRPSAARYKFVGRIEATTSTNDIVDAAVTANAELRRKAKALGADVIKLDVIAPPSDSEHPHRRVILAGRAYKKSS